MKNSLNRILIESTVRKTLNEIKEDPERSTRNLVDMALHFSEGRFQRRFLEMAQDMLKNEQSCYYRMIPDAVANIHPERIVTFGMNLGYNSCTEGARKIRAIEEEKHFNIPWSISLELNEAYFSKNRDIYHSLINQGEQLGVYTWMFYFRDTLAPAVELAINHPDSAFIFFSSPEAITEARLEELDRVYNVMFVLRLTDNTKVACDLLRAKNYLYSLFVSYEESDIPELINDDILSDAELLHPIFTAFMPAPSCSEKTRKQVHQYLTDTREAQTFRTIPWDLLYDTETIDSVISENACTLHFQENGIIAPYIPSSAPEPLSFFTQSLADILKQFSPKL